MRRIPAVAAAVTLTAAALTGCAATPAAVTPPPAATFTAPPATGTAVTVNGVTYVPCPEEDYEGPTPCFWDAGARGNGKGVSFLVSGGVRTYL